MSCPWRAASALPSRADDIRFTILAPRALTPDSCIRGWQPGDRLDLGGWSTPVAELLRAHLVAGHLRPVSPVIADDAKIAAVVGVRTAAWAKPRRDEPVIVIEREVTS